MSYLKNLIALALATVIKKNKKNKNKDSKKSKAIINQKKNDVIELKTEIEVLKSKIEALEREIEALERDKDLEAIKYTISPLNTQVQSILWSPALNIIQDSPTKADDLNYFIRCANLMVSIDKLRFLLNSRDSQPSTPACTKDALFTSREKLKDNYLTLETEVKTLEKRAENLIETGEQKFKLSSTAEEELKAIKDRITPLSNQLEACFMESQFKYN